MTEDEYRELVEQAHLIEQLTKEPGWAAFYDFLVNKTLPLRRQLTSGNCKNMEEYKEMAGYVKGIEWALSAPEQVLTLVETAAELVDQNVS